MSSQVFSHKTFKQSLKKYYSFYTGGFIAFVVALAIGGAFLIPEGRRLAELARMPGHDSSEIRDRARRRFLVARVDLSVLILGLVAMVFRPGG